MTYRHVVSADYVPCLVKKITFDGGTTEDRIKWNNERENKIPEDTTLGKKLSFPSGREVKAFCLLCGGWS